MKRSLSLLSVVFLVLFLWAQAPQKMSYQAIIRNTNGDVVTNRSIGMRISILQNSSTGTVVYSEIQTPTTNINGLVSLEIGTGNAVTGTFSQISWANNTYFIKTETDLDGGNNYTIVGTSQLLSVPYALHAKTAEHFSEKDSIFIVSPAHDITVAHINKLSNLSGINTGDQDLSGLATIISLNTKVDKETGKTLSSNDYSDAEKTKLSGIAEGANNYVHPVTHAPSIIAQDANNRFVTDAEKTVWQSKLAANDTVGLSNRINTKVTSVAGKTLSTNDYSDTEKTKLSGIAEGANNYVHPVTHAPSIIAQDANNRFVTDAEKTVWQSKLAANDTVGLSNRINTKVTSVAGKTLSTNDYSDTEKTKLSGIAEGANNYVHPVTHAPSIIAQDANNRFVTDAEKTVWQSKLAANDTVGLSNRINTKVTSVAGKALSSNDYSDAEKTKLSGIAEGANNYVHPVTHAPSIIAQDANNRFVTDAEKAVWQSKLTANDTVSLSNRINTKITSESGKGLSSNDYSDAEKTKLLGIAEGANNYVHPVTHAPSIIAQDANNRFVTDAEKVVWQSKLGANDTLSLSNRINTKVTEIAGKALSSNDYSDAEKTKLSGIAEGANNYVHPVTHAPSIIAQDANNRFVTDAEKVVWQSKLTANDTVSLSNRINTKVSSVAGKALSSNDYSDAEKTKLLGIAEGANNYVHPVTHAPSIIAQDANNRFVTDAEKVVWQSKLGANDTLSLSNRINTKVTEIAGKALSSNDYSDAEKTKLSGIAEGANNYVHPVTHAPSIIAQDANNRFVTDVEKAVWQSKLTANDTVSLSNRINTKVSSVAGKALSSNDYSDAEKTKLSEIAEGATAYTDIMANARVAAGINALNLGNTSMQDSTNIKISGGKINGTSIGATSPQLGAFTSLSANNGLTVTGAVSLPNYSLTVDNISGLTSLLSFKSNEGHEHPISDISNLQENLNSKLNRDNPLFTGTIQGNGSLLSSLNASSITSGIINSTLIDQSITRDEELYAAINSLSLGNLSTQNKNYVSITGGSIEGVEIGLNYPASAKFVNVNANSITLSPNSITDDEVFDNLTIEAGSVNNTPIGNYNPSTGAFTNLSVNGTFSLPNNRITDDMVQDNLTIRGGVINSTEIGLMTSANGRFNSLTVEGPSLSIGSGSNIYTLPLVKGTNGQVLKTNDFGVVSWGDDRGALLTESNTWLDKQIIDVSSMNYQDRDGLVVNKKGNGKAIVANGGVDLTQGNLKLTKGDVLLSEGSMSINTTTDSQTGVFINQNNSSYGLVVSSGDTTRTVSSSPLVLIQNDSKGIENTEDSISSRALVVVNTNPENKSTALLATVSTGGEGVGSALEAIAEKGTAIIASSAEGKSIEATGDVAITGNTSVTGNLSATTFNLTYSAQNLSPDLSTVTGSVISVNGDQTITNLPTGTNGKIIYIVNAGTGVVTLPNSLGTIAASKVASLVAVGTVWYRIN